MALGIAPARGGVGSGGGGGSSGSTRTPSAQAFSTGLAGGFSGSIGAGASSGVGSGVSGLGIGGGVGRQVGGPTPTNYNPRAGVTSYQSSPFGMLSAQHQYNVQAANQQAGYQSSLLAQDRYRNVDLGIASNNAQNRYNSSQYGITAGSIGDQQRLLDKQRSLSQQQYNAQLANSQVAWEQAQQWLTDQAKFVGLQGELDQSMTTAQRAQLADILGLAQSENRQGIGLVERGYEGDMADVAHQRSMNERTWQNLQGALSADSANALERYGLSEKDIKELQGYNREDWAELQRQINEQRGFNDRSWTETQRDIDSRRATTDEDHAIMQWLNAQNVGSNDTARQLGLDQAAFQQAERDRQARSDAVARGARTSRGHSQDLDASAGQRALSDRGANLNWQSTSDQLAAQLRSGNNNYEAALNDIQGAYNRGELSFDQAQAAAQAAWNQGDIGFRQQRDSLLNQMTGATLSYGEAMDQVAAQRAAGLQSYDSGRYQADAAARNAGLNRAGALTSLQQRLAQAQLQAEHGNQDLDLRGIQQQFDRQQAYAGLQNQRDVGQIQYDTDRVNMSFQNRANNLGFTGQQNSLATQLAAARNQNQYNQSQFNINNRSLDSLAQTYGTRARQNMSGLQNQINQLGSNYANQISQMYAQGANQGGMSQIMQLLAQYGY